MNSRFDELLPFYVNGTLQAADRDWVDDYVKAHPDAAAELHWARSLQARLHEDVPAVSSEVGLERTMQRIRGEQPAAARKPAAAAAPSWFERLRDVVAALMPQAVLRPALAGAMALVAVQAVVILHMAQQPVDDATQLRTIAGSGAAEAGPYLKVNFKGDAREADIRLLLVEVHGNLAAGPGQLGDYYIEVPANNQDAVADKLRASSIVDAVAIVDGLPPRR